jgi:hypothetical protein
MQLLPMNVPAELHRMIGDSGDCDASTAQVTVARGPLVIMAYGLMAIDPAERDCFWITSAAGDLTPDATEEVLREWNTRRRN